MYDPRFVKDNPSEAEVEDMKGTKRRERKTAWKKTFQDLNSSPLHLLQLQMN